MDIAIVIILCLIGLVLILLEIFLIPGITFVAIAGILFLVGGIYYAFSQIGTTAGVITSLVSALGTGFAIIYLIKSKVLDKTIALKTDINSTISSEIQLNISEGDIGMTVSRLNPVGKVKVNGVTMEAKTLGDFIDEDTEIIVLKATPTQLTVTTNINNS